MAGTGARGPGHDGQGSGYAGLLAPGAPLELRRRLHRLAAGIAWDLGRRRGQALGVALAALGLCWAMPSPWAGLLADGLLVTLLALGLPQDRPPSPVGLSLPPLQRLAGPVLLLGLFLGLRLLPLGAAQQVPWPDRLASSATLIAWGALWLVLAEVLLRRTGPGFVPLALLALPAVTLLCAPVSLNPLFPLAIRPALVLCPLIGAARAQGLEVIHQPLVYDLTNLDSLEFHYPPWYLHLVFSTLLAAACWLAAARLEERRR
ncbi:MAG: hypothetical protein FJ125_01255 [Deltaproteobacteria bacterium]|nr:hypothetical protein [Deltaproteobacteria bacterium]